jgi:hypothetical protein
VINAIVGQVPLPKLLIDMPVRFERALMECLTFYKSEYSEKLGQLECIIYFVTQTRHTDCIFSIFFMT